MLNSQNFRSNDDKDPPGWTEDWWNQGQHQTLTESLQTLMNITKDRKKWDNNCERVHIQKSHKASQWSLNRTFLFLGFIYSRKKIIRIVFLIRILMICLIHFTPMLHFYTLWKQKILHLRETNFQRGGAKVKKKGPM